MRRLLLVILLALPWPAFAADPVALPAPIGAPGRAYLDAVHGSGAAAEVTYYDPGRPAPALSTDVTVPAPQPPEPDRGDSGGSLDLGPWVVGGVAVALLVAVLLLAARFGGARAVSFAQTPGRGSRDRVRRPGVDAPRPETDPGPAGLEEILRMADRRRALHVLLQRSLEHASTANGQRPGRSQTARDVIGALPPSWPLLPALRAVAGQAEVVQFGGRNLTEDMFRASVEAARPIFGAAGRPVPGR